MGSLKAILSDFLPTARLTLQLFDYSAAHYFCLLASMNSPTSHKNMGDFGIRTPEDFDKLNFGVRLHPENFKSKFAMPVNVDIDLYYVIRLGDRTGPLIGGVSIQQRNKSVPPDIGWCVLEEYQGNGYATEAAKKLLRLAQEDLGIREVISWPAAHNLPSNAVARKAGFVECKTDSSEDHVAFCLPGMTFDGSVNLSLYGTE